jgi:hypothetical protein
MAAEDFSVLDGGFNAKKSIIPSGSRHPVMAQRFDEYGGHLEL